MQASHPQGPLMNSPEDIEDRTRISRIGPLSFFWEPEHRGLWSSPNRKFLRLPLHAQEADNDFGQLKDYCRHPKKTRWMEATQPFLAFWPAYVAYVGPFEHLRLIPGKVPIIRDPQSGHRFQFILSTELVNAWEALEWKMVHLSTGLLRRHMQFKYEWSEIRVPVLPYECGYNRFFSHENFAAGAAYASRNAFTCLSAYLSFCIALDMSKNPTQAGEPPSWLIFGEIELGLDPTWLNDIHQSFICNFTPGFRPGAYVRYNQIVYAEVFPAFVVANVPLYICWGFRPGWMANTSKMWGYRPTQLEAKRAIDRYCNRLRPEDDPRDGIRFWYNMGPQPSLPPTLQPPHVPPSSFVVLQQLPAPPSDRNLPAPPSVEPMNWISENDDRDSPLSPLHVVATSDDDDPYLRELEEGLHRRLDTPEPVVDDYDAWLCDWEKERSAAKHTETLEESQSRDTDEAQAEKENNDKDLLEPTIGEYMFIWVRGDGSTLQRQVIPRGEWQDAWYYYSPDERFYDSATKEWHLIEQGSRPPAEEEEYPQDLQHPQPLTFDEPLTLKELGPVVAQYEAPAPIEDAIVDQFRKYYTVTESSTTYGGSSDGELQSGKRKRGVETSTPNKKHGPVDNRGAKHLKNPPAVQPVTSFTYVVSYTPRPIPNIRNLLRSAYGLVVPTPYAGQLRQTDTEEGELEEGEVGSSRSTQTAALRRLGLSTGALDDELKQCIWDLFAFVYESEPTPPLSAPLWDFAPSLRQDIVAHPYFHYHRVTDKLYIIGVRGKPLVDQWYFLVVDDARVVIELFRQGFDSLGEITRHLLKSGIPFSTPKCLKSLRNVRNARVRTFGFRKLRHLFTESDYKDYEHEKQKLLNGPGGRAALMAGGIIWRLAVDNVKVKQVLAGPSSAAEHVHTFEKRKAVDDRLSTEAEDVICGVYRVYTGDGQTQTEDASWFPKPNVWKASGLDHGYWTVDNEAWYKKRVEEIRQGGQPFNSRKWKSVLNLNREKYAKAFRAFFSDTSDKLLTGDTSYWQ